MKLTLNSHLTIRGEGRRIIQNRKIPHYLNFVHTEVSNGLSAEPTQFPSDNEPEDTQDSAKKK